MSDMLLMGIGGATGGAPVINALLLEDGSYVLLEDGTEILLEI